MRKIIVITSLILSAFINGCATVRMASIEDDKVRKEFSSPSQGTAGLYIYRNSVLGTALKKSVYVDGQLIGETASMTYLYKEVQPGNRKLSTESEFSNNDLILDVKNGKNYFVHQYIKLGVFAGGANLELVSEEEGKKGVLQCKLAGMFNNESLTYTSKIDETVNEQTVISEQSELGTYISGIYVSDITSDKIWAFKKESDRNIRIFFTQNGNKITGINDSVNLKVIGTREGDTIKFVMLINQMNGLNEAKGVWKINADGTRIEGTWEITGFGGATGKWNLTKVE